MFEKNIEMSLIRMNREINLTVVHCIQAHVVGHEHRHVYVLLELVAVDHTLG